jgi:hypothetical protein
VAKQGKVIPIFRGTTGLNNIIDPARIKYDPDTGIQELAIAVNVDIDSSLRASRRKGYTQVLAKGAHSLFSCGNYCLFVSGDALCVLDQGYSWTAIRNVTNNARMSYVNVDNEIYYANGYENGVVRDRISYAWVGESYVGPTTTRTFSDPPIGHLLEIYNGRLYIAQGKILWYSEPFAYSWYDLARSYIPFADRITMVRAVKDGLYVSTEREVFFSGGGHPTEFGRTHIADYPAIEGTDLIVDGSKIGRGDVSDRVAMWASTKGICTGGPGGYFRNLTERRLIYPYARYGAGLLKHKKYICTLEP